MFHFRTAELGQPEFYKISFLGADLSVIRLKVY